VLVIGAVGDVSVELSRARPRAPPTSPVIVARHIAFVSHQSLRVPVLSTAVRGVVRRGQRASSPAESQLRRRGRAGTDCDIYKHGRGGHGGSTEGRPGSPVFAVSPPSVSSHAGDGRQRRQARGGPPRARRNNVVHPFVWRGATLSSTPRGTVYDACGGGDPVVGDLGASTTHAAAWQWNAPGSSLRVDLVARHGVPRPRWTATRQVADPHDRRRAGVRIHTLGLNPLDRELANAFELSLEQDRGGRHSPGTGAACWPLAGGRARHRRSPPQAASATR
jgi:hypothetical protein